MSTIGPEADAGILASEITSQVVYTKLYRRPTWPGESSGPTVGDGYDLGQTPRATIQADWRGRVPDAMLAVMISCSGHTGMAGKIKTAQVRDLIDIPWETALAVHRERVIPRWIAGVERNLPNTNLLHPEQLGVLVSLCYNRGFSFRKVGDTKDAKGRDRYFEMRGILAAMQSKSFDKVPGLIRSMKRLWNPRSGLISRREREAKLWEKYAKLAVLPSEASKVPMPAVKPTLGVRPATLMTPVDDAPESDIDTSDDVAGDVSPTRPDDAEHVGASGQAERYAAVQDLLRQKGFYAGRVDGDFGDRTEDAIINAKRALGLPIALPDGTADLDLTDEFVAQLTLMPAREVGEFRANATPKQVAAEVPAVQAGLRARAVAIWTSVTTFAASAFGWLSDNVDAVKEQAKPIIDAGGVVPWYVWAMCAGGVVLLIVHTQGKAVSAATADYHAGRTA